MNNGALEAITYWWEKLKPLRMSFCRETYLSGYDDDDLEQECYLILVKALIQYDVSQGVPFAYYYKLQLKGWRSNMNRKTNSKFYAHVGNGEVQEEEDEKTHIEEGVITGMMAQNVLIALQNLSILDQQIIVDYYIADKDIKAIAKKQGLTYKQIEYRKQKSIKQLRKWLKVGGFND